MNLRQITDAIIGEDRETMRQAFGLLVVHPEAGKVEAHSPGMLVVALNRLCDALADDSVEMPPATCDALGVDGAASYATGVVAVRANWSFFSRQIVAGR